MTPTFDTLAQARQAGYQTVQNHLCVDRYRGVRVTLVDASGEGRVGYIYKVIVMHPTRRDALGERILLYQSGVVSRQVCLRNEKNHVKQPGYFANMVAPDLLEAAMQHVRAAIDLALGPETTQRISDDGQKA